MLRPLRFAVIAVSVILVVLSAPAYACPSAGGSVRVAGFDAPTLADSRVIAGQNDNSLLVLYTSGRSLADATLTVRVPRRDWPTPLVGTGVVNSVDLNIGSAVVRPDPLVGATYEPSIPAGRACSWAATEPAVRATASVQVVVVAHLTCTPGQQIAIRLRNVQAPDRPGNYPLTVRVADVGAARPGLIALATVDPVPANRLHVVAPASVTTNQPFTVQVSALDRNGRIDRGYRGSVALSTQPYDCSQQPTITAVAHRFTAADRGTAEITVVFSSVNPHRIEVRDIARGARAGVSNPFTTVLGNPFGVCPVHYD